MKDFTLPIMLCTKAAEQSQEMMADTSKAACDASTLSRASVEALSEVYDPLLELLMLSGSQFPDALAKVLLPVVDRYVYDRSLCKLASLMIVVWVVSKMNVFRLTC